MGFLSVYFSLTDANKKIYSGSVLVAKIESLYDEDGKCLTESVQFNDKQDEVIYEYDIEGRLVKRSHKGCTMYYSYDESGKLLNGSRTIRYQVTE